MSQQIQAIFENGVLRPLTPLVLLEKSHVSVTVDEGSVATTDEVLRRSQQDALNATFAAVDQLPQTPRNDGLSGRDHDQILYGSPQ